jgi:drug/metabolite transporter (DMT)-like permease
MSLPDNKKNFYSGIALAVLTTIIWSGNYVIARGISKQVGPFSLAFFRWATASVCIAPFAIRKFKQESKLVLSNAKYIFWAALTGVTIFNTMIYLAGHYTSAINLALIGTTSAPVFAAILAAIFLKEHIGIYRTIGMTICIIGILFLLSHGSWEQFSKLRFGKGDVLILMSAFCFAIYNTLVRKKPAGISPINFLFVIFVLGTLILLPFYLYETMHSDPIQWNKNIVIIILYLGIGNSVISFLCWNAAIARLGASGTALFGNLIPIFSTIEAIVFLGEDFLTIHLISGVLVIGGLIIANLKKPVLKPS